MSEETAPTMSRRHQHNLALCRPAARRALDALRWTPLNAVRVEGVRHGRAFVLVPTKSSIAGFRPAENILLAGFV